MKMIAERAPQIFVAARCERSRYRAGIRAALNRFAASDPAGKESARFGCSDFEIWNQENELERRGDRETLPNCAVSNIETTELCRGGVIWMPFQLSAKLKDFAAPQRSTGKPIQSMHHAETDSDTAAEAARYGNVAVHLARERKRASLGSRKKKIRGRAHHGIGPQSTAAAERDLVVNPQRDAKTIKARTKIRGARGDADGDLLHDRTGAARRC